MAVSILTDKTTNEEFLDFIVDQIHNVVVATTKPNGEPDAQVCDLLMHKGDKLYIVTSHKNPFFKSLISRKEVVVDGYKGDGTMDSCGFSMRGTIKNVEHEYIDEIFDKNKYLFEIYKDNVEKAKEDLRVLEITPGHCGYLDHRTNPIYTRSFDFE